MQAELTLRNDNLGVFDCFCTKCGMLTPFIGKGINLPHNGGQLRDGNKLANPPSAFAIRVICQRDYNSYLYVFHSVNGRIYKIGQHPSLSDISFGELRGIDGVLDALDRKELGTAIGLFSHDAASGAFVYLRRVFERMILRAYEREASERGAIEDFHKLRMHEKIAALRNQLPNRVVKNGGVFSVISVGIHELSDEECKAMFPVVKAVIFQMLEEEAHKRKREIADRNTDDALQILLAQTQVKNARMTTEQPPSDSQA